MTTRKESAQDIETAIRMFKQKSLDEETFFQRLEIYIADLRRGKNWSVLFANNQQFIEIFTSNVKKSKGWWQQKILTIV